MIFKNKASKYGFYFGRICAGIGALTILSSLPFICIEFGSSIINIKGVIAALTGFLIYWYGMYRTRGSI